MNVNFYILQNKSKENYMELIYKLINKAYKNNKKIITLASEEDLPIISELLWNTKKDSFLAHEIINNTFDIKTNIKTSIYLINVNKTIDKEPLLLWCKESNTNIILDTTPYCDLLFNNKNIFISSYQEDEYIKSARYKYQKYQKLTSNVNTYNIGQ